MVKGTKSKTQKEAKIDNVDFNPPSSPVIPEEEGKKKTKKEKVEEPVAAEEETGLILLDGGQEPEELEAGEIIDPNFKKEVRDEIKKLTSVVDRESFRIAEILDEVATQKLFKNWGFKSFKDYVEEEIYFEHRKAMYLVQINQWLSIFPEEDREKVRSIGWSKAKELIQVVTPDNFYQWMKMIEGKSLREIIELTKDGKKKAKSADTTITVDGDIDDHDGAVEKPVKLTFSLFPAQHQAVMEALGKAMQIAETEKMGHALSLICMDYMQTHVDSIDLQSYMKKFENFLGDGFSVIVYDNDDQSFVYNEEKIDEIIASIPDELEEDYDDDDEE